jgi:hypothetical protein
LEGGEVVGSGLLFFWEVEFGIFMLELHRHGYGIGTRYPFREFAAWSFVY